jgi:non-ribosomal peptide synthetase component F
LLEILNAFAAQVRVRPNEIATAHHDQSLTFEGLDAATDRLAHLLHERRRGENDVVGYLNTVGIETIQLNLATLKAGQCVIALDPGHPVAAPAELVQHSGMGVITAPAQHLELARQLMGDAVIEIPADTPDRTAIPVFEPVDCPSDSFANVSYTSGSSGKPKGAVASRALLTEKWRRSRICEFTPDDIAACFINFRWEDQLRPVTDGRRCNGSISGRWAPRCWLIGLAKSRLPISHHTREFFGS